MQRAREVDTQDDKKSREVCGLEGLSGGLVTDEDMEMNEFLIQAVNGVPAVIQQQTNVAIKYLYKDGEIGPTLTPRQVRDLTDMVGTTLLPSYSLLGTWGPRIMGIITLLSLLWFLLMAGLRCRDIYKQKGFGVWMVGALSVTLWNLIRTPHALVKTTLHTLGEQIIQNAEQIGQAKEADCVAKHMAAEA